MKRCNEDRCNVAESRLEAAEKELLLVKAERDELLKYGEDWEAAALVVIGQLGCPADLPEPLDVAAAIRRLGNTLRARAEAAEKALQAKNESYERLLTLSERASNQVGALNAALEGSRKEVAALRAVLGDVLKYAHLVSHEAFVGPWERARAALAAPNLGADYVDASKATSGVTMERHRAQLRRVAEAVRQACFDIADYGAGGHRQVADSIRACNLDAVIAECVK